jgi:hypothetical protein
MIFFTADMIAKERSNDLRYNFRPRLPDELADSELADSELADSELADSELADSELAVSEVRPRRPRRRVGRLQGLSVWVGYRMIDLGVRLARPGVVAEARARL